MLNLVLLVLVCSPQALLVHQIAYQGEERHKSFKLWASIPTDNWELDFPTEISLPCPASTEPYCLLTDTNFTV